MLEAAATEPRTPTPAAGLGRQAKTGGGDVFALLLGGGSAAESVPEARRDKTASPAPAAAAAKPASRGRSADGQEADAGNSPAAQNNGHQPQTTPDQAAAPVAPNPAPAASAQVQTGPLQSGAETAAQEPGLVPTSPQDTGQTPAPQPQTLQSTANGQAPANPSLQAGSPVPPESLASTAAGPAKMKAKAGQSANQAANPTASNQATGPAAVASQEAMAATKQSDGTATPSSDAQSTPPKANSDTKAGGAGSEVGAVAIKTPSAPGAKEPPSAQEPTATAPRSTLAVNPAASGQTQGQASNGQNGHADGGAKQGATNKGQGNSTAEQRAAALADRLANATAAERALNSLAAGQGQTDNAASPPQDGFDGALIQATQSQTGANAADAPLSASHARPAPPAPGVQLAVQIHAAVSNRLQRFSIRLEPAELGRIDVRLEFSRDGHVRARVSADRRETLDLLQKDVHGLERALRDAGANADKLNLTFDLRGDGRQAGAGSDRGSQAPKGEGAGGLGDAQPDADETPQPTRRIDALVDMHV